MADYTLVRGAGDAARTDYRDGYGASMGAAGAFTRISKHISEGVGKAVQDKNREFNKAMKAELNRDPSISDEAWKGLYERLEKKRFKYVYLNKKDRILAEQDLKKEADEYLKIENGKTNIAETVTDEKLFDNPDWVASPQGDDVKGISTGENKVVYDDNGRPGYMISSNASASNYVGVNEEGNLALASYKEAWGDGRFTVSEDGKTKTAPEEFGGKSYPNTPEGLQQFENDSEEFYKKEHEKTGGTWNLNIDSQTGKQSTHKTWMSIDEVEELVKENSVDVESKGAIETMVSQSALAASELQVGENSEFNYQRNYDTVKAQIIEKGNLQSLADNKIIEGRTFKTDLFDAISDVTYEELNIEQSSIAGLSLTKEQIEEMDPSKGDGKITPVDAGVILNEIMNNEDMLKDYLAEYYTNFIEQNWNNNVKKEVGLDFSSSGSFNDAFRAAKEQLGPAAMFTWNGNKYTTGEANEINLEDEDTI